MKVERARLSLLIRSSRVCGGGSKTGCAYRFLERPATAISKGEPAMSTFGTAVVVAVITVLLGCLVRLVASLCRPSSADEQYRIGREAERSNLRGAAWWFSESPATMQLLLDLSNGVGAEEARAKWRAANRDFSQGA